MSNDNANGAFGKLLQNIIEQLLSYCIDIGSGFVKNKQFGFTQYCTNESNQLLLSQTNTVTGRLYVCGKSTIKAFE